MKPTFLCIGVQKGGTTSFIEYMNQHPEIYMKEGESHFFNNTNQNSLTISMYESSFTPKKNKHIIGEKTPKYCYIQHAMTNIYNYNPNIKLVIILREPIQRAFSHYNMSYTNPNKFMETILNRNSNTFSGSYIPRGFYDNQLEHILSMFPRNNIYIGIAEEIRNNKQVEYNKIFKFLGAKAEHRINDTVDTRIGTYKESVKKEDAKILYDIYKSHNETLYNLLGRRIQIWEEYYSTLS